MKPTCPKCGSNEIVEWNTVQARYPITEVAIDSPRDGMWPQEHGAPDVAWDASEAHEEDPFQCRDCSHEFGDFDHMVEEADNG